MLKERLCLKGICPERVLTRFRSQRIAVYDAVKTDVNTLCFSVQRQDAERVYALYPQAKKGNDSPYTTQRLPARGGLKIIRFFKNSVGIVVGGICFVALTCVADRAVMKIDIDAPAVYHAQVQAVLKENGIKQYAFYPKGKEDLVCARLLPLDGVSYCSVKKSGSVLKVTIKTNSFFLPSTENEFLAERSGWVTRLVTLSGTNVAEVGRQVEKGARLVEGGIYSADGERQSVPIVAYAQLTCEYVGEYACEEEKEAFATAYLEAGLQEEGAQLTSYEIEKKETTYLVKLSYLWTQRIRI